MARLDLDRLRSHLDVPESWVTRSTLDESRETYARVRRTYAPILTPYGFRGLLTLPGENEKFGKGSGRPIYGLALAPASTSGRNVCERSTPECRTHCVATAGNGGIPNVHAARVARTALLDEHPRAFLRLLVEDLDRAMRGPRLPAVRLNTFSDIRYEEILPAWVWNRYRAARFYDYTKYMPGDRVHLPQNYRLAHSYAGQRNLYEFLYACAAYDRVPVAVIDVRGGRDRRTGKFRPLPSTYLGLRVIDGDLNDRRYLDRSGIVLLRRKGTLPAGASRFVLPRDSEEVDRVDLYPVPVPVVIGGTR